jgi:phosphoribosylformylglycinamidine synthase PurS subunit
MLVEIRVKCREGISDPQSVAAAQMLAAHGVASARQEKLLSMSTEESNTWDVYRQVVGMCKELLANPVYEEFSFQLEYKWHGATAKLQSPWYHHSGGRWKIRRV